jgi:AcrR family transcriptional regulator
MSQTINPIYFTEIEQFQKRRPSKSDRRKLQIIEQTLEELATRGMDETTYDSLAKACGISRALVQHYFPDRDELFLIAFRFARAKFQKVCVEAIEKHTTPQKQLKAYFEAACSWPRIFPQDAKVWTLFFYHCAIKKKYRKLHSELSGAGHIRVAALMASYGVGSEVLTANQIMNAITGYCVATVTEEHTKEFNQQLLDSTIDLCLTLAKIPKDA